MPSADRSVSRSRTARLASLAVVLLLSTFACRGAAQQLSAPALTPSRPTSITAGDLHNVFRIDGTLFSGNSPTTDAEFAALAQLGVKVVVSVDGGKPRTDLARKHGMRYVHLPIGYDGVPANRVAELVKTASAAEGPIYVHCHHGKHRGPAAAAVICRGVKNWNAEEAAQWLNQAGTGSEYAGLYRDARNFQKPGAVVLAEVPERLPEIAETPAVVDRMVALDDYLEVLKSAQKAGWHTADGKPKPHEIATLVWEELRELGREADTEHRGQQYRQRMETSMTAADRLRGHLASGEVNAPAAEDALQALSTSCTDCHKKHRQ